MKPKQYFTDFDEEHLLTIPAIIIEMEERELTETIISEAVRETGVDHFWCKAEGESFEKEEDTCGRECGDYEPRNGKNGCCKYRGYCYLPGKEYLLTIDGKLTKVREEQK